MWTWRSSLRGSRRRMEFPVPGFGGVGGEAELQCVTHQPLVGGERSLSGRIGGTVGAADVEIDRTSGVVGAPARGSHPFRGGLLRPVFLHGSLEEDLLMGDAAVPGYDRQGIRRNSIGLGGGLQFCIGLISLALEEYLLVFVMPVVDSNGCNIGLRRLHDRFDAPLCSRTVTAAGAEARRRDGMSGGGVLEIPSRLFQFTGSCAGRHQTRHVGA